MAITDSPFRVEIYDKDFLRKGWVQSYEALSVTPAHNAVGTATIQVAMDHNRIDALVADGARLRITYHGDFLFSGAISQMSGQGPKNASTVSFTAQSDWRLLNNILGWPNPTQDIFHQGYDDDGELLGDYDVKTGPAETVVKYFVTANAQRLGLLDVDPATGAPVVVVAPDLGRGTAVTAKMRFHPLGESRSGGLFPAVEQAGIGVSVEQVGKSLVVDCYTPQVRTRRLTEESGVLVGWSWSKSTHNGSRVIAGGQGEAEDRDFRLLTDLERETDFGRSSLVEIFRDARDVELGNYSLLLKRAQESLTDTAPKSGIQAVLAETATFRYGRTAKVGDVIPIRVGPGVEITDTLRTATLTDNSSGVTAVPVVGDPQAAEGHDKLVAKSISRLAAGLRALRSER